MNIKKYDDEEESGLLFKANEEKITPRQIKCLRCSTVEYENATEKRLFLHLKQ
jgi:hypothetical protein